ncbi:unnamed protein product [Ambrosiozyma monospora]|uniref:Unnamed protein product n=1 Tax=Ambrosiozyma monospora TaxID=43982 RepID=A0ACB5U855_AMBMO|nr:unnamed protein product [Ambrosiozyma monospora]
MIMTKLDLMVFLFAFKFQRSLVACERCRKSHKKCLLSETPSAEDKCIRCQQQGFDCIWGSSVVQKQPANDVSSISKPKNAKPAANRKRKTLTGKSMSLTWAPALTTKRKSGVQKHQSYKKSARLFQDELIYADAVKHKENNSQFVTSTQPLATILSKDSFLCLEGESLGLYSPWQNTSQYGQRKGPKPDTIDPDLVAYLKAKHAFELPSLKDRVKQVKLFMDNLYPLYPVVDRSILEQVESGTDLETVTSGEIGGVSLLLLNAMMLAGVNKSNVDAIIFIDVNP